MPELIGSTTDSAADTATAASNALPPAARTSMPASVASEWALAMAAPGGACSAAMPAWALAGAGAAVLAGAPSPAQAVSPASRTERKRDRGSGRTGLLLYQPAPPSATSLASSCSWVSG